MRSSPQSPIAADTVSVRAVSPQNPIDADTVSMRTVSSRTSRGEAIAVVVTVIGAILMCLAIGSSIFLAVLVNR